MRSLIPTGRGELDDADLELAYQAPPGRYCRLNFVVSVDGAVEVDGASGRLGGPGDRKVFNLLRAHADVVLVGAGTARRENYGPVRVTKAWSAGRARRGQPPIPRLAVVTRSGMIDLSARFLADRADGGPRPIIVTCDAVAPERRQELSAVAEVLVCGDHDVDLTDALHRLSRLDLDQVLCEGGPTLAGGLVGAGLVDELCLTLSPLVVGPPWPSAEPTTLARPSLFGGKPWVGGPIDLTLSHLLDSNGLLLARYRLNGA